MFYEYFFQFYYELVSAVDRMFTKYLLKTLDHKTSHKGQLFDIVWIA